MHLRSTGITDLVLRTLVVQHGMVYQDCDASGRWVTVKKKNTSECDFTDSSPVRTVAGVLITSVTDAATTH